MVLPYALADRRALVNEKLAQDEVPRIQVAWEDTLFRVWYNVNGHVGTPDTPRDSATLDGNVLLLDRMEMSRERRRRFRWECKICFGGILGDDAVFAARHVVLTRC